MIAKGNTHDNGARLARYITTGKERELAELWELRGFALRDIVDAFRSVHVMAAKGQCRQPFFHVQVRNPEGEHLTRDQWFAAINQIESAMRLTDQPRAIAVHINDQTGHEHIHIAWSRIDPDTLRAKALPFFKLRLKQVCRDLERSFGLTPVTDERERAIRFAPRRAEDEQARRLQVDLNATRETIRLCFERSDCGRSFRDALAQENLVLARGDRRDFLAVDRAGGMHTIGKRILGVSAAEIRNRLVGLCPDHLPSLDEARKLISSKPVSQDNHVDHSSSQVRNAPRLIDESTSASAVTAEKKTRAAGKKLHRDRVTKQHVIRRAHVPLDHAATKPAMLESLLECQGAHLEGLANEVPEPPVEAAKNAESSFDFTGPQGQGREPLPPDATATLTPVTMAPPIVEPLSPQHKNPVYSARLRDQFRAVLKQLTAKILEPQPTPRKRRREEIGGAFRKTALGLLRRIARFTPLHFLNPTFEPFTWLRLWEYNSPASMDFHQEGSVSPPPEDLSLRL